jgi:hypothetical protein
MIVLTYYKLLKKNPDFSRRPLNVLITAIALVVRKVYSNDRTLTIEDYARHCPGMKAETLAAAERSLVTALAFDLNFAEQLYEDTMGVLHSNPPVASDQELARLREESLRDTPHGGDMIDYKRRVEEDYDRRVKEDRHRRGASFLRTLNGVFNLMPSATETSSIGGEGGERAAPSGTK